MKFHSQASCQKHFAAYGWIVFERNMQRSITILIASTAFKTTTWDPNFRHPRRYFLRIRRSTSCSRRRAFPHAQSRVWRLRAGGQNNLPLLLWRECFDAACGCTTSMAAMPIITQSASGHRHCHPLDDVIPGIKGRLRAAAWDVYFTGSRRISSRQRRTDGRFVCVVELNECNFLKVAAVDWMIMHPETVKKNRLLSRPPGWRTRFSFLFF